MLGITLSMISMALAIPAVYGTETEVRKPILSLLISLRDFPFTNIIVTSLLWVAYTCILLRELRELRWLLVMTLVSFFAVFITAATYPSLAESYAENIEPVTPVGGLLMALPIFFAMFLPTLLVITYRRLVAKKRVHQNGTGG